jgi:hypothetical protein
MDLTAVATERTTAGTNVLLAAAVLVGLAYLRGTTPPSPTRSLWLGALGAFGLAVGLGAVLHGLATGEALTRALWQAVYLLLAVVLAMFMAGAVAARWGYPAARRALPFLLALAGAFYLAMQYAAGDFRVFVLFEAIALIFAVSLYAQLARRRRAGAGRMALGLGLSLAAGLVQPMKSLMVRCIWTFDHNGVFHLIQLLGLVILVQGLRTTLQSPVGEDPEQVA